MRDPARIDAIVGLLHALWRKYPEWRLGQLVLNAHAAARSPGEVYFAEDDVLEDGLRKLLGGPSDGGGERVQKAA
jgi:hypothetical protein